MDRSTFAAGRQRTPLCSSWETGLAIILVLLLWLVGDAMALADTEAGWAEGLVYSGTDQAPCECVSSSGVVAYAEWLNWQAHRGGMDFASFVDPIWLTPATLETADYDRDNGLRVGLGYRFDSLWDVSWNYTYFQTSAAGRSIRQSIPAWC